MGVDDIGTDEVEVLTARFAEFATVTAKRLPLYRRLAEGAAADPDVARRLLLGAPDQQVPTLLLAAVHDTLLAGHDDPLRAWYASVVDRPRPVGSGNDDPWPAFRRLALEDEHVAHRLATAHTQTNEVGRCAFLLPALAQLATDAPGAPVDGHRPLGLVEVGTSAGLNLLFDRYGYRYEPSSQQPMDPVSTLGEDAPLLLTATLRGERRPPVPEAFPPIASRVGVDLQPVDLSDRDQARWLVACQWPDQPERIHRARTAIAQAHGAFGPDGDAQVLAGDAVDRVADLVRSVPQHAFPVVVATWVLGYLSLDQQGAFLAELDGVAEERELSLVFAEHPQWVPGLPVPDRADGVVDHRPTALVRIDWRREGRTVTRLADVHPHGTWLEWLDG